MARTAAWTTFLAGAGLRSGPPVSRRWQRGRTGERWTVPVLRHPLYLGSLLIGLSAGLFLQSPYSNLPWLLFVIYASSTIPIEESVLRSRYEAEFEGTSSASPVVAGMAPVSHATAGDGRCAGARNEAARAARWVWIPIAAQMLTFLRAEPWWPRIFHRF